MESRYVIFATIEGAISGERVQAFCYKGVAVQYAKELIKGGAETVVVYEVKMGEKHLIEALGKRATKSQLRKWAARTPAIVAGYDKYTLHDF